MPAYCVEKYNLIFELQYETEFYFDWQDIISFNYTENVKES